MMPREGWNEQQKKVGAEMKAQIVEKAIPKTDDSLPGIPADDVSLSIIVFPSGKFWVAYWILS